jgi:hypothetical protein
LVALNISTTIIAMSPHNWFLIWWWLWWLESVSKFPSVSSTPFLIWNSLFNPKLYWISQVDMLINPGCRDGQARGVDIFPLRKWWSPLMIATQPWSISRWNPFKIYHQPMVVTSCDVCSSAEVSIHFHQVLGLRCCPGHGLWGTQGLTNENWVYDPWGQECLIFTKCGEVPSKIYEF